MDRHLTKFAGANEMLPSHKPKRFSSQVVSRPVVSNASLIERTL
jgi:hypothetical protein